MNKEDQEMALIKDAAQSKLVNFCRYIDPNYKVNWHHRIIANKLQEAYEKVLQGERSRIILQVPPRHGKSNLASTKFPAYVLGQNPDYPIITTSYSKELASDFGLQTKDLMKTQNYQALFDTRLRKDATAKAKWMTQSGGGYTAAGVGGSITGKGFKCLAEGTKVTTTSGDKSIEEVKAGDMVLSLDGDLCYNKVVATKKSKDITYGITLGGNYIRATGDHRFFVLGQGWTKAEDLQEGDKAIKVKQDLQAVREKERRKGSLLSRLLQRDEECGHRSYLRLLRQSIFQKSLRIKKSYQAGCKASFLFSGLCSKIPGRETEKNMQGMWRKADRDKDLSFLQRLQNKKIFRFGKDRLQRMWKNISSSISSYKVLFSKLQKRLSFARNDGRGKFELQAWISTGRISKRILSNEKGNNKKRQRTMCSMWEQGRSDSTSQGLQSEEQQERKLSNSLQNLPYDSSQLEQLTVSSIECIEEEVDVYDLQVENAENFFAENVLVHNCGIVDDPIKNREEADSEVIREKIWKWWQSTFITREDGNGAMIVIATRWHEDDLIGRILSDDWDGNPDDWEVIKFPALATENEEYRDKGEPLWPEKFDKEFLENKKNNAGPYEFSSLYQQEPVDEESREFKNEWIKRIPWEKVDMKDTRDFATIDPGGEDIEQDHTGIIRNYVDARNNWHIRAMRVHIGSDELINYIFQLHDEGFEKIGIEETIYLNTIKPFLDQEKRKRDKFPNIEPLKHARRNKHVRIRGLVPRYSSGSVYHIEKECEDLEGEMRKFPNATYDDTLDALAYQNDIAKAPIDDVARAVRKRDRDNRKEESKAKYGL